MEVPPPKSLITPIDVPHRLQLGAGPANVSPRVLQAMSQPVLGPYNDAIFKILDEVKDGLKYVFQTKNELTLAVSGSGHCAMEAIMCNLVEEGDIVLIAMSGFWSERAYIMAERYGGVPKKVVSTPGKSFTLAELESAIIKHKPVLLFIVQGDSSSGVYQALEGLGEICHKHNCLLTVDAIVSAGGAPLLVDVWGIDVAISGTQKALGVPPGLAPITFSPRAQERIFKRKSVVKVFYLDMKELGNYWNCFNQPIRIYHHTPSSNLLYGLRESLAMIAEEGIENVLERHRSVVHLFRKGLEAMGLSLFVSDASMRLPTVTTINLPADVDMAQLIKFCLEKHQIEIAAGVGPTAGKALRIGLMGYNATPKNAQIMLNALAEGIQHIRQNKK